MCCSGTTNFWIFQELEALRFSKKGLIKCATCKNPTAWVCAVLQCLGWRDNGHAVLLYSVRYTFTDSVIARPSLLKLIFSWQRQWYRVVSFHLAISGNAIIIYTRKCIELRYMTWPLRWSFRASISRLRQRALLKLCVYAKRQFGFRTGTSVCTLGTPRRSISKYEKSISSVFFCVEAWFRNITAPVFVK
jgi:hypothetical protein